MASPQIVGKEPRRVRAVKLCAPEVMVDRRPDDVRAREARALARLLWRGRLRALARWGREPLLYRGWFPYLVGKLRRAWA